MGRETYPQNPRWRRILSLQVCYWPNWGEGGASTIPGSSRIRGWRSPLTADSSVLGAAYFDQVPSRALLAETDGTKLIGYKDVWGEKLALRFLDGAAFYISTGLPLAEPGEGGASTPDSSLGSSRNGG